MGSLFEAAGDPTSGTLHWYLDPIDPADHGLEGCWCDPVVWQRCPVSVGEDAPCSEGCPVCGGVSYVEDDCYPLPLVYSHRDLGGDVGGDHG